MKLLIKNIKELVQVEPDEMRLRVSGADMAHLPTLQNAYLAIEDGYIVDFGSMDEFGGIADWRDLQIIDAAGKMVFPAWCDSHTHIVYAGSRENEFVDKIKGLSYEEIAANGGGILNSALRLQQATEDELYEAAFNRLNEMAGFGTGAVEIKSGYGLSVEAELKMLRVIKRLKETHPITIKANFLGAHAVPTEYKNNREAYIDLIINEMLPQIQQEGLADYIDVFCDKGFYTVEETERILAAGVEAGLTPKIHANELGFTGGIQAGVKYGALSVDHLEYTGDEEIEVLMNSNTMPTLLPSTAFYLKFDYPPARKMIDAGLPIALATDYNPGSSPSGNLPFVLSLACIYLKMTPEEAINATTINSAYAMDVVEELGSIAVGKKANLFITKPIPGYNFIPYSFGSNLIDQVILNGEVFTK